MKTPRQLASVKHIQEDVNRVCDELGVEVQWIQPWHFRLDGVTDVYTRSQRWHNIKSGERGNTGYIEKFVRRFAERQAHKKVRKQTHENPA